jgi:hypothetical protein
MFHGLMNNPVNEVQGFVSALEADDSSSVMYYLDVITSDEGVYVETRHIKLFSDRERYVCDATVCIGHVFRTSEQFS